MPRSLGSLSATAPIISVNGTQPHTSKLQRHSKAKDTLTEPGRIPPTSNAGDGVRIWTEDIGEILHRRMDHQFMSKMFGETEYCDHGEAGLWYDNDLQLAAELGKTLLERNRDLENQLKASQQTQYEQAKEIDLLAKQLDALRNVNDSRMRIYEEVDRSLQELEKTNEKFRHEIRSDKDKIKRLTETVETLELKCTELNTKLEDIQSHERQRKKHERQRTWNSVPSLVESSDAEGKFDYLGFPSIYSKANDKKSPVESEPMKKLKEKLKVIQVDLAREQRKKEETETQLAQAIKLNQELSKKLERIEQDQEELAISEHESFTPDLRLGQLMCRTCRSAASETSSVADAGELLEHDIEEVSKGQVVRLKCGGSAYGSRESLHMIGLEADDATMETGSDILVSGHYTWRMEDDEQKSPNADVSLLGELEAQYRRLVRKYEILIETKSQRAAAKEVSTQDNLDEPASASASASGVVMRQKSPKSNREAQTSWRKSLNLTMDLRSPVDPIEGHFENGPPEYKRLFKEIFDTLQRSAAYEDDATNQFGKKSPSTSPEETRVGLGEKSG